MSDAIDRLVNDFDAAWRGPTPPSLDDFIPPPGSADRAAALPQLIQVDLERRIKAGLQVRVEGYLQRYPELMRNEPAVLSLMRNENELRRRPPVFVPPRRLGEYELGRELGRGGMGVVYEARHALLDRRAAVKVLGPAVQGDDDAAARFRREIVAGGKLDHPNLVRYTHAGEDAGHLYLVMELLEGVDLARHVERVGPLPIADACKYASHAASALQHAHEQGMVHRDVKPSNLFVTSAGAVKLLDLGLARMRGSSDLGLTAAAGGEMGTPDYIPPEQWENAHFVDIRADIYALGCTLHHLLTGRPPFAHCPDTDAKRAAHRRVPPPSVREARPEVPPELAAVIDRMLSKHPEGRPDDPAEVIRLLAPFCDRPTVGPTLPRDKPRPSRRRQVVALGLLVVGLVGMALATRGCAVQPHPRAAERVSGGPS